MSDQNKPQVPPKPAPREVNIRCRASQNCEGITAQVVFEKPQDGGGKVVRYKCSRCKKTWHINY